MLPVIRMLRGAMVLAENPGVVGDDLSLSVADGLVVVDGDLAGDGFNDAEDGGAAFGIGIGPAHVVGANLVHETAASAGGACLFDQNFAGVESDGLDRFVV